MNMNEQVTTYMEGLAPWQAAIAGALRQVVFAVLPDVQERLQYGKPHYLKGKQYVAVIGVAKGWVSFTIFNATTVNAPPDRFESSETGDRKTVKIKEGEAVDAELLQRLLAEAVSTL
jgi:hypothetical protein